MAGYASYLRVYEPLATFPSAERRRWERYLAEGQAPDRASGARIEHEAALAATVSPRLDVDNEHAFVLYVDGLPYLCPWHTQLRVWEALTEFRAGLPDVVAEAFVPAALADAAEAQLERWRAQDPSPRVHIRSATWKVPLPWFLLFEASERVAVVEHRAGAEPSRSLTYTTAMSSARRRAARALSIVRRAMGDEPVVGEIEDLGRWLEDFHPYSRVELDYGGLAELMTEDELREDTSVSDLAEGLRALREGDAERAAAAYERVTSRWAGVQALESAS